MFYQDAIENKLRFGDVVKGFLSTTPILKRPFVDEKAESYTIDVSTNLSVLLDPCCSIGSGTVSITPLVQIKQQFWDNPHLFEDMTEINREVKPKNLMHPVVWNKLSDDDKTQFLNAPKGYGLKNFFVYKEHPVFEEYEIIKKNRFEEFIDGETGLPKYNEIQEVHTLKTRYHIIDFKNISHVSCMEIVGSEKPITEKVLSSIVLQLSEKTRAELRNKMGYYFGRTPEEDLP